MLLRPIIHDQIDKQRDSKPQTKTLNTKREFNRWFYWATLTPKLQRWNQTINWLGVPRRVQTCEITMQRCAPHRCTRTTCTRDPRISNSRMIPTVPFMLCASHRAYLPMLYTHTYMRNPARSLPFSHSHSPQIVIAYSDRVSTSGALTLCHTLAF